MKVSYWMMKVSYWLMKVSYWMTVFGTGVTQQ